MKRMFFISLVAAANVLDRRNTRQGATDWSTHIEEEDGCAGLRYHSVGDWGHAVMKSILCGAALAAVLAATPAWATLPGELPPQAESINFQHVIKTESGRTHYWDRITHQRERSAISGAVLVMEVLRGPGQSTCDG
jgi:hypothetical protein